MNPIVISAIIGATMGVITIAGILIFSIYRRFVTNKKVIEIIQAAKIKSQRFLNQTKADNKNFFHNRLKEINEKEKIRKLIHDNKISLLKEKETNLAVKYNEWKDYEEKLKQLSKENEAKAAKNEEERIKVIKQLENIANITEKEAREELFTNIEKKEIKTLNKITKEIKNKIENNLKEMTNTILANAIERTASEFVEEYSTSTILLANNEMKGKIIGKEGRNIKSFEAVSGTDLIIEKDSNVIKISSFNPIRREIAAQALNSLIKDGRIQPQRIEDTWKKEKENIEIVIRENGKKTIEELGITNMESRLVYHVGMLKYRMSFGQNCLEHCIEVAKITGALARELRLDDDIAVRAGLLHDIGKSIDYEVGESHVDAGVKLAQKYNESKIVVNAIHSHHGDVPTDNVYSVLVSAADTISAARPGARDNVQEDYLKRMETIEKICNSISGIKTSYAVKSGRLIRIFVDPIQVSDYEASKICEQVKTQVKNEIQIAGEIKVIVIREKRIEGIIV